jgi:hypothetical protein
MDKFNSHKSWLSKGKRLRLYVAVAVPVRVPRLEDGAQPRVENLQVQYDFIYIVTSVLVLPDRVRYIVEYDLTSSL